jgi:hypothetical protein
VSKKDSLLKAFGLQSGWCREYGSPFTADLIAALAQDLERTGPAAALVGAWPGEPLADAVALRLTGALHAAALSGRDPALAAVFPAADPHWTITKVWPVAQALLERDQDWVRAFIQSAPQTNETRRTIGLLPGFLRTAEQGPLHLLEIGASAGLNLHWDRFRFETRTWSFGPKDGPLIDTQWLGPPPQGLDRTIKVASRAGCDINPLDVSDPEQRHRLTAYVWADQPERLARIERAIALSLQSGLRPVKMDAAAFLTERLGGPLPEGTTVIFHSVVWQYLPEATKQGVRAAIEAAASCATPTHRLAWLRYEPDLWDVNMHPALSAGGFHVTLTAWPTGDARILAETDGHTRSVTPRRE